MTPPEKSYIEWWNAKPWWEKLANAIVAGYAAYWLAKR